MNELNFAYWLQGYFELSKVNGEIKLNQDQINMIDRHLNLVFNKVTEFKIDLLNQHSKNRISDKSLCDTFFHGIDLEKEKEELFVQYKNQASC
jgi:hypothetical protein